MRIYVLKGYLCFIHKKSKVVSALLGVMSPSLWTHALRSLTDDLERKMGKACWQDSDRTTLRGEGDITDGRIQMPKCLESLDSHQQAFNINSCTQVQKFNCRGSLGETSLMDCIHWMRISFSWQVLDSLCSLQSRWVWRNMFCSGNGTKKGSYQSWVCPENSSWDSEPFGNCGQ